MSRKFRKYKLLLDEGLPPRKRFKILNSRHSLAHIKHDLGKSGISDREVWNVATQQKRIVVTYNARDFEKLAPLSKNSGVIAVSSNLSNEMIDKKLTSLLSRRKKGNFFGKFIYITGESKTF